MNGWRVLITPSAERAIRKLPKKCGEFVFEAFPKVAKENPLAGQQLSGPLSWLRSFHFSVEGKPYRVAYSLDSRKREIIIHYGGYRGGFYERLRKHLQR